jgi:hypothetical protein
MADEQTGALEAALAQAEIEAGTVLRAASRVVKALRGMQKAAQQGDLRKLRAAPDAIRQSMNTLDAQVTQVEASWSFDEESYLRDGRFVAELLEEARRQGVRLIQQDDRLYSYPVLISVSPGDRMVKIDRKPERTIRPSVLIGMLRERQRAQPRFRSGAFLESLWAAYQIVLERKGQKGEVGPVVPLRDIYDLFTLMPGQKREYTLPEFTRDVYLLDQESELTTNNGATIAFHASTGTKSERNILSIVTQTGAEKRYFGISFSKDSA